MPVLLKSCIIHGTRDLPHPHDPMCMWKQTLVLSRSIGMMYQNTLLMFSLVIQILKDIRFTKVSMVEKTGETHQVVFMIRMGCLQAGDPIGNLIYRQKATPSIVFIPIPMIVKRKIDGIIASAVKIHISPGSVSETILEWK